MYLSFGFLITTSQKSSSLMSISGFLILENKVFDFLLLAKWKDRRQQEQPKPFASFIEELVADIPPDILATLPADGAEQHDHYIYGTPKREL